MLNYIMGGNMTVDDEIPHTSVPVMSLLPDTESVSPYRSSVDCVKHLLNSVHRDGDTGLLYRVIYIVRIYKED